MSSTIISGLDGVSFGMVLFFVAVGLSLIMGVMRILNLAHGAFYMLGGYVGWTLSVRAGAGFWMALLAAGLSVALVGVIAEKAVLRRMRGALDNQVLATLGLLYIATNIVIWLWSGEPKAPVVPSPLNRSVQISGQPYPLSRLVIISAGVLVVGGAWWLEEHTIWGSRLRAGIDDRDIAMTLGVNVDRLSAVVFAMGSFLAGIGGMLGQIFTGLTPAQGTDMLLLALIVVIIGGVGRIKATVAGALVVGIVNSFGYRLVPSLAPYLGYAVMIGVLIVRPSGIFGNVAASSK